MSGSEFEREVMESLGELKAGQRTTETALNQIDSKLVAMRRGPCEQGAVHESRLTRAEDDLRNLARKNGTSARRNAITVAVPTAAVGGALAMALNWIVEQLTGK